jgi:hypothetical protein
MWDMCGEGWMIRLGLTGLYGSLPVRAAEVAGCSTA